MTYKYSQYNLIVECKEKNGDVYIWNSRSGAIVSFKKEKYDLIVDENYNHPDIEPLVKDLLLQGIIVPEQLDEYNQICFSQKQVQYSTNFDSLNLIIAPTLQCNYRCVYCFEESQGQKTVMSNETIANIVSFVEKQITINKTIKQLDIAWFGGEPLMAYYSAMKPLGEKLINLCKEHSINYRSKITTNGFYLENDIIKNIVDELNVTSFQITFDGTCANYCSRKGVAPSAYSKTKNNLFELSQYLSKANPKAHISLRINVDNDNVGNAKELVDEIRSDVRFCDNIHFYLGHLIGYCGSLNYMSVEEYERSELDFSEFLSETIKPKEPKKIWCGQFSMSSLCIGPEGEIYKCEHDFGVKDRIIGNVVDGIFYNEHLISFLEQPYPVECRNCSIFPVCLGGCPSARFLSKDHKHCEYTQNYLKKLVKDYIRK